MTYKARILFGTIIKVHGFEGAVTIKLDKSFLEEIPEPESVFLEIEGKPVPFFIASYEYPGGDILWLKFRGYESGHKVREFVGCRVFLTTGENQSSPENDFRELTGFKVLATTNSGIGTIEGIIENPGQLLLQVRTRAGKEILIPLHEDLIMKIDRKKKIIKMDLPEGLMEL